MSGEIEAGRETDALVAEKVFGLVRCQSLHHDGHFPNTYCYAPPDYPDQGSEVRMYSTDISDAWRVVENLDNRNSVAREMGITRFCINRYDDGYTARFFNSGATARSAPLAICLAALAAVGAQRGEK